MSGPHHPRAWAAIDLLRFACAMLVVARHYCAALPLRPNPAAAAMLSGVTLDSRWAEWTSWGWVGVELFFVISGYVIACSAVESAPRDFLRRRAQRLLPAAWVCATLTLAALAMMGAAGWRVLGAEWLRSVAFWPLGDAIDPSYWTLGVEAAFYLLVAWRLRGGGAAARIETIAWWIGGASLAFWIAQVALGTVDGTWMEERLAQLLLLPHGAFFAIGILLHAWHRAGASPARALGLGLFLGAGAIEIVAHAVDQAAGLGVSANPVAPLITFALGVGVIAGCRRLQSLFPGGGRGPDSAQSAEMHAAARDSFWGLGPCLRRGTGNFTATLGLMTYPLYLLHQQIGAAIVAAFGPGAFPVALLVVIALSWVVVRFAEPPLRRIVGNVLSVRRGPLPDRRPSASPSGG